MFAARPPEREPGGLTRAARRGVRGRAGLKAADGDHLVPRPDSDGEGAGAAPTDPDEGGREEVAWQLVWQLGARIVPGQRNSRNMQGF